MITPGQAFGLLAAAILAWLFFIGAANGAWVLWERFNG